MNVLYGTDYPDPEMLQMLKEYLSQVQEKNEMGKGAYIWPIIRAVPIRMLCTRNKELRNLILCCFLQ